MILFPCIDFANLTDKWSILELKIAGLTNWAGPFRSEFSSGLGRAVQAKIFKLIGPGRYGQKFLRAGQKIQIVRYTIFVCLTHIIWAIYFMSLKPNGPSVKHSQMSFIS